MREFNPAMDGRRRERKAMKDAFLAGYDAGAQNHPRECPYLECAAFAPIIGQWLKGHEAGLTDRLRVNATSGRIRAWHGRRRDNESV